MLVVRSAVFWVVMVTLTTAVGLLLVALAILGFGRLQHVVSGPLIGAWARVALWLAGVRVEVGGREHIAERKARVVVVNHSSTLDLALIPYLAPPAPTALAKAELRWVPPLNLALWALGAVFVDRSGRARSVGALKRATGRIIRNRHTLIIAPEGTRSRDGKLGRFKLGAFHFAHDTGLEIVPIVVQGAHQRIAAGGFRVTPGTVRITVHPPRPPPVDPRAAANALRSEYLEWLGEGV